MSDKYQMRLVVSKFVESLDKFVPLEKPVCIDVVFRGDKADIDKIAPYLRSYFDVGTFYGDWAGIGRGEYVDGTITLG